MLEAEIRPGQADGSIRRGDPALLAHAVLLDGHVVRPVDRACRMCGGARLDASCRAAGRRARPSCSRTRYLAAGDRLAERRRLAQREPAALESWPSSTRRTPVDVLVIGGGVTGAGVALDAATRGLSVVLAEKHDLAFGTSRWSSKLVHGGLRYLASGAVGIARESAVERGILIERTAPHLVRALPQVVAAAAVGRRADQAALVRAGFLAGDALRATAGTSRRTLPRSASCRWRRGAPAGPDRAHRRVARRPCSPGTASSATTRGWSLRLRAPRPRTAPGS